MVPKTQQASRMLLAGTRTKKAWMREHQMQLDLNFSMLLQVGKLCFAQSDSHFLICKMGTTLISEGFSCRVSV